MAATAKEIHVAIPRRLPWQENLARAVLDSPARFIVAVMGRRAGKTHIAAEIAGLAALRTGGLVFWGAPTLDIARIGYDTFRQLWRPAIRGEKISPHIEAVLANGGKILWRSFDRPGAALGRGIDLAIVDEAARVKKEIVYQDLLPTLADRGGKCLAITTPRGRRNWVFDWYTKAASGSDEYAAVRGPSTENPLPVLHEYVERMKEEMPEHLFRQEFLAEFVEGGGAVFRRIRDCIRPGGWLDAPPDGVACVIGCDLAKHVDWTVLVAMDSATGDCLAMDRFQRVDWTLVLERIKTFAARWRAPIVLDSTGVGDPIFDQLSAAGVPTVPFKFTEETKSRLVVALATAIERGEISFPEDPVLVGELEAYSYEELPSGRYRYNAPEGQHDDCVMALALANWGRVKGGVLEGSGWL